jgi:hypothetical protein
MCTGTEPGHVSMNKMDTHANICCTGANWAIMYLTGDVCKVTPFLDFCTYLCNQGAGH